LLPPPLDRLSPSQLTRKAYILQDMVQAPKSKLRNRARARTASLLIVLAAGAISAAAQAALPADPERDLVLVLDCEGKGNYASAAKTVSGIITGAVSSSDSYAAVSPESRDKALDELAFSLSDLADPSARERLGKLTSARFILSSRIDSGEGELFLVLSLIEASTGRIARGETRPYRSVGTMIDGAEGQTLVCLGLQASDDQRKVLRVKNATELVQALGPDRIVRLAPGRYDLSGLFIVKNRSVDWVDEYDGPCPVVKGVSNLALVGETAPGASAEIVIAPAYGWVLSFEACTGIRISGLVIGHTKPGYCLGGVLRFARCDDTEIRSCELYGSGTYGLGLERSTKFSIAGSTVRDCTYGLATVDRCEDLLFQSTVFSGTGEFELFEVRASAHLLFRDCEFSRNHGQSLFSVDGESRDFRILSSRFLNNRVKAFCSGEGNPSLEDAVFKGNSFKRPN
jgi:hypothetical protein